MGTGAIRNMRRQRSWLAHWLVAVLLLPLLIGILPQPALSVEASLAQDLALSVCSPFEDHQSDGERGHKPAHEQHCIVCSAGCPLCAPALPVNQALSLPSTATNRTLEYDSRDVIPVYGVLWHGSPPRGPPTSWMI